MSEEIFLINRLTDAEKEVLKNKALFEVQRSGKEMDDSQNLTVNDVNDYQRDEIMDCRGRENVREFNNIKIQDKEGENGNGVYDLNFIE